MTENDLIDWLGTIEAEEKIIKDCLYAISNYISEDPEDANLYMEGCSLDRLTLKLRKFYVIVDWSERQYSHIIALVPIVYDGKEIGRYEAFFRLNGEMYDDLMVINGQEQIVY